jgi:malate dehydrogenase (oxaloacetate-decarboxylating)
VLDIPVFHDDQHGTAIVVLAALKNAAAVTGRELGDLQIVISGAGAAGIAVTAMLQEAGVGDVAVGDSHGMIHAGRANLTDVKRRLAEHTNAANRVGSIESALAGADVFIGVSGGHIGEDAIASMAKESIVFALANPEPEVDPKIAAHHARVVATGRSDYPNQINNVLAFPGVFKGALSVGATRITDGMKLAAADALAGVVGDDRRDDYVIPEVFDPRVAPTVAGAVAAAAHADGVSRHRSPGQH